MNELGKTAISFGAFRLHPQERTLERDRRPVFLTPKEFDTLAILVDAKGRVVSKEELLDRVWPGTYVADGSLARNISVIRKALGESVIETIPRRGYRLATPAFDDSTFLSPGNKTRNQTECFAASADSLPLESQEPAPASCQDQAPVNLRSLYWRALAFAAVLTLAAVTVLLLSRISVSNATESTLKGRVRIAVLPFENYTGNPQDEYLCDGLTEATISELSRLNPGHLSVIARTSVVKFKNANRTIPQISAELKADYILESSVRGSAGRLRVTTQLVRGSDASHVWTGEYDRTIESVLNVQQQVAVAIAGEIRLKVDPSLTARPHRPVDAKAYQDYLLGRYHWNFRNREGLMKSVEFFERAIARDPQYAEAYAGLADSYLVLGGGYLPDIETYNKARAAATRAMELDNTLSDAYSALAYEKFVNERDMTGADEDYQRALTLDPNNANAHHWYALYLSAMKRHEEAIQHINRAVELDPLAIGIRYNAAWIYMAADRTEVAFAMAQHALEMDPSSAPAQGILAALYVSKGQYEEAIAEMRAAQGVRASYSPYAVEVAHIYALEGKKQLARRLLNSVLSGSGWQKAAPYSFAVTYAALGEKDKSFYWLQRSVDDHSCTATEINNDHGLDPLRSDPRFLRIAQPFGLISEQTQIAR